MGKTISKKIHFYGGLFLIIIGSILLISNVIGFYFYTTIDNNNVNLSDKNHRTISEEIFWNLAYKNDNEATEEYVKRLTNLISNYMLKINPKYSKPTFFENWILYCYAKKLGYYEWLDTKKAVRLGGGFCSQNAIIFNNILQLQSIKSRILASKGHVLNEVMINNKWQVVDTDYNVFFTYSLKELESHPNIVYQIYKASRNDEYEANYMKKVFEKVGSFRSFKSSQDYKKIDYYIEETSFYLIWVIPFLLIMLGIVTLKRTVS